MGHQRSSVWATIPRCKIGGSLVCEFPAASAAKKNVSGAFSNTPLKASIVMFKTQTGYWLVRRFYYPVYWGLWRSRESLETNQYSGIVICNLLLKRLAPACDSQTDPLSRTEPKNAGLPSMQHAVCAQLRRAYCWAMLSSRLLKLWHQNHWPPWFWVTEKERRTMWVFSFPNFWSWHKRQHWRNGIHSVPSLRSI